MATITLKGNPIHTSGELPARGTAIKDFVLVRRDLSEATLADYSGKKKILNVYVSLDTSVCAASIKHFYKETAQLSDVIVLNISADLPAAAARFCGAEGVDNAETLSSYRSSFADDYGLRIVDGPLRGLCSRAVIVVDEDNNVLYTEQVPEIGQEPDYAKALEAVKETSKSRA